MLLVDCLFALLCIYHFIKGLNALKNDDKQAVRDSLIALFMFCLVFTIGVYVVEFFLGSDSDL